MSATSGCGVPSITPQPPTATSIIVDKSPTIVVATATAITNNNINSTNVNVNSNNIVVGDLINSSKLEPSTNNTHLQHLTSSQQQPINLAHTTTGTGSSSNSSSSSTSGQQQQHIVTSGLRTSGTSSVLQLHPIGTFRSTTTTTSKGTALNSSTILTNTTNAINSNNITSGIGTTPTSIISVNRTGPNLTILPGRVPFHTTGSNGSATLQFARGTTILRPAGTLNSGQPGSITVTPISGSSIRLASATVNNGSWVPSGTSPIGTTFTPIRPIQIAGRAIRPETKLIHIPQQGGTVQHLTQLQVVDSKGTTILKPHLSGTPIVRTIQTSNPNVTGTQMAVPITPSFTIRTATIPNTRPHSINPTVQKVITQPAHGPPIQLVSGSKLSQHTIQTITPIPRLTLSNPVCLTISSSASLTTNSTTPTVAVASKSGGSTNLIMNQTLAPGNAIPLTKIYEVNPILNMFAKNQSSTTNNTGTVSISMASTNSSLQSHITNAQLAVSTTNPTMQLPNTSLGTNVQLHGLGSNSNTSASAGLPSTNNTSASFYLGQKNVNVIHASGPVPIRPITIEKRQEVRTKNNKSGNVRSAPIIITTTTTTTQSNHSGLTNHSSSQLTIPIGPHTFAHPISITNPGTGQQQVLTAAPTINHPTTLLTTITTPTNSSVSSSGVSSTNNISIIGGQQQSLTLSGHIIATPNASHSTSHVIPTHFISSQPANCPVTTLSTSMLTVPTIPSTTSVIVTTASVVNNLNCGVPSSLQTSTAISGISSVPATSPSIIVSNPNSSSNSSIPPSQSPSQNQTTTQTKTTLSPRPSILRKRDAPSSDNNIQLRAQRNLALNFGVPNSNSGSGSSASGCNSVSAAVSATVSAAANKENKENPNILSLPGINSISGLNSLKKDFQPPNEESSWQSCSSNSSSGSTTLSTTSETAEIQLQQQSLGVTISNLSNAPSSSIYNVSNGINSVINPTTILPNLILSSTSSQNTQSPFRTTNAPSGRSRLSSTSKASNKDLDRVKCVKGKDDHVSPRKKPRKQQLTTSDLLESSSSEISFYQGKRLKKNELLDPSLFQGFPDKFSPEAQKEEPPTPKFSYFIKKPHLSLLQNDKLIGKTRLNHFQKYSDVKPKDDKRPTLVELANQKDIFQKVNAWKLQHLSNHLEDVIQSETNVVSDFNSLLTQIEAKIGPNNSNRDLNRIQELLKGNIQRCKVISDQMSEAKSQVARILEHKAVVNDMLSKYVNKRPTKKRERL